MNKNMIIFMPKIVLRLSNASIRNFEIFFITDGDLEFITAINLCIKGHV